MEWQCIGHNPTRWGLGTREDDQIVDIVATVQRRDDGRWWWFVSRLCDIEPSRETAMAAAERHWRVQVAVR